MGDWLDNKVKPIRIKMHGQRAKSVFRYGLDHLRLVLLGISEKMDDFLICLRILSCT